MAELSVNSEEHDAIEDSEASLGGSGADEKASDDQDSGEKPSADNSDVDMDADEAPARCSSIASHSYASLCAVLPASLSQTMPVIETLHTSCARSFCSCICSSSRIDSAESDTACNLSGSCSLLTFPTLCLQGER